MDFMKVFYWRYLNSSLSLFTLSLSSSLITFLYLNFDGKSVLPFELISGELGMFVLSEPKKELRTVTGFLETSLGFILSFISFSSLIISKPISSFSSMSRTRLRKGIPLLRGLNFFWHLLSTYSSVFSCFSGPQSISPKAKWCSFRWNWLSNSLGLRSSSFYWVCRRWSFCSMVGIG